MNRGNVFLIVGALLCMYFLSCQGIGFADIGMAAFLAPGTAETAESQAAVDKAIPPKAPGGEKLASNAGLNLGKTMLPSNAGVGRGANFLDMHTDDSKIVVLPASSVLAMSTEQVTAIYALAQEQVTGVSIAAATDAQINGVIAKFVEARVIASAVPLNDFINQTGIPMGILGNDAIISIEDLFKKQGGVVANCTLNNLDPAVVKAIKGAV